MCVYMYKYMQIYKGKYTYTHMYLFIFLEFLQNILCGLQKYVLYTGK